MEKRVYVIGHRNPDTDSVVSAAAYSRLKQAQGLSHCYPARAGQISPQTEYIFDRFQVPVPEYLPDLIPRAAYYLSDPPATVRGETPLWEALDLMQRDSLKVLPVVDRDGVYVNMLHYKAFARYIITKINPHKKAAFPTSIDLLIDTLHAQPITIFNNQEVKNSTIVVAALREPSFRAHLETEIPENALVIVGDQTDIQRYCAERRVRALVLSSGNTPDKETIALAEKNQVSLIISPFDTASTAMLIIYSAPVSAIGDPDVPLVRLGDTINSIRGPLSRAPSRCLPVADEAGRVQGVIFEGDLIGEPNIEVIMVDHNEQAQAIEGIENYKILEVIDHHRLGNGTTRYPITFINKPVGATCTIITNLYRETRTPLDRGIASILLCGILADTLNLQSATTSDTDRETAEYLSSITGLEIKTLGAELFTAANQINARPARELVTMDMKEYTEGSAAFSVSQIETTHPADLSKRRDEILSALEQVYAAKKRLFSALLVTDVTTMDSLLFVTGDKTFRGHINFPPVEEGVYLLKGVVSRKKQLIPLLSELVEEHLKG
jgi:manganese-dependent inorganic pyrophosphatase